MKTKLKWHYTLEAVPNACGKYLLVVCGKGTDCHFEVGTWDVWKKGWEDGSAFDPAHVVCWARLQWSEDFMEDKDEE